MRRASSFADRLTHDRYSACVVLVLAALAAWLSGWRAVLDPYPYYESPFARCLGLVVALYAAAVVVYYYWHPYRVIGVVAPAASAWYVWAVLEFAGVVRAAWPYGLFAGAILAAGLRLTAAFRPIHRVILYVIVLALPLGFAVVIVGHFLLHFVARHWMVPILGSVAALYPDVLAISDSPYALPLVTIPLALLAWTRLFRPAYELALEPPLWWHYHVRGAGPGVAAMPARGPCLILANHACYLDPVFLGKVLPRPVTAMMTARFADRPLLRWLAITVYDIVRVPEKPLKHDPKEVQDAIERLDRGEALLVFPEGYLRRSEDVPLRRFGRGVWQILKARPDTPVFAVWIDGAWGSWMSYHNGPPTKNKKRDFRRPIGVGVSAPVTVPAAVLENHWQTRIFLMNEVAAARKHLGLPGLPPFELPAKGDEEEAAGDAGAGR